MRWRIRLYLKLLMIVVGFPYNIISDASIHFPGALGLYSTRVSQGSIYMQKCLCELEYYVFVLII